MGKIKHAREFLGRLRQELHRELEPEERAETDALALKAHHWFQESPVVLFTFFERVIVLSLVAWGYQHTSGWLSGVLQVSFWVLLVAMAASVANYSKPLPTGKTRAEALGRSRWFLLALGAGVYWGAMALAFQLADVLGEIQFDAKNPPAVPCQSVAYAVVNRCGIYPPPDPKPAPPLKIPAKPAMD